VTGGSDEYNPKETSENDGYAKIWDLVEGQK
jgi:chromatin assembly factor 1 subunit B